MNFLVAVGEADSCFADSVIWKAIGLVPVGESSVYLRSYISESFLVPSAAAVRVR